MACKSLKSKKGIVVVMGLLLTFATITVIGQPNTALNLTDSAGNSLLFLDNSGNVGVGTTSPSFPLDVAGIIRSSNGGVMFPDGTVQITAAAGGDDNLGNHTATQNIILNGNWLSGDGDNEGVFVDSITGNVGIGTLVPSHRLDVEGHVGIRHSGALFFFDANDTDSATIQYTGNLLQFGGNNANRGYRFIAGSSAVVQIDSFGNIGIGTTTPVRGLHISGTGVTSEFVLENTSLSPNMRRFNIWMIDDKTRFRVLDDAGSGGLEWMIVDNQNGNIGLGTTIPTEKLHVVGNVLVRGSVTADAYEFPSSKRWKTNIETIENALEKVSQLRGVSYDWKENGKHDIGLIAEEVGEIVPEVVVYEDNGIDAKSVDYPRLIALLIEAVKEQQKEIDTLKKDNAELRQTQAALESLKAENAELKQQMSQFSATLQRLEALVTVPENPDSARAGEE